MKTPATNAKPGDIVTSKWSSSGAKWRVSGLFIDKHERPAAFIVSLTSKRKDSRRLKDLVIVEEAEA